MVTGPEKLNQPLAVLFSGPPATGKSTLADAIARELMAPVVAWDWLVAGLTPFPEVQHVLDTIERDTYRDVGYFVECLCSDIEVHRSRVEGRVRAIPGWNELDWKFVRLSRTSYAPLASEKLVLDAVDPIDENLARVRLYLGLGNNAADRSDAEAR